MEERKGAGKVFNSAEPGAKVSTPAAQISRCDGKQLQKDEVAGIGCRGTTSQASKLRAKSEIGAQPLASVDRGATTASSRIDNHLPTETYTVRLTISRSENAISLNSKIHMCRMHSSSRSCRKFYRRITICLSGQASQPSTSIHYQGRVSVPTPALFLVWALTNV